MQHMSMMSMCIRANGVIRKDSLHYLDPMKDCGEDMKVEHKHVVLTLFVLKSNTRKSRRRYY